MKLTFGKMTMHSFMSFLDESFDFEGAEGMVLVRGVNNDAPQGETNGSGKSTVGYGLMYALFGETYADIRKSENLVSRGAEDRQMSVRLSFRADDAKYELERGLLRGKNQYLKLAAFQDGEWKDVTKSTIAETQKFLEREILRCDSSIFLRTILLTADQTYNFYKLKKQDKKEFVEKLFDIQAFGDMYDAIHKDQLKLDRQLAASQNQLFVMSRNVSDYESRSKQFEEAASARRKSAADALEAAKKARDEFASKTVATNEDAVAKLKEAVRKLKDGESKCVSGMDLLRQELRKMDLSADKARLGVRQRQEMIEKHADLLGRLCDDCKPVFSKYYSLDKAQKEMDSLNEGLAKLKEKRDAEADKLEKAEAEKKRYADRLGQADDMMDKLTRESSEHARRLSQLEAQVARAESEKAAADSAQNPYQGMAEQARKDAEEEAGKADKLARKVKYLETAGRVVSQDTLRKFIIKDLIWILNNRIRKYLVQLGASYYVQFDEDMDYEFVPTVGTCEFGNFSGGERMRLMIATSFAFRDFMSIRNGLSSNVLILDEYFDSAISSTCIQCLVGILKEYRKESGLNIFVITHRPEVQVEAFDRIATVEKTGGASRISVSEVG